MNALAGDAVTAGAGAAGAAGAGGAAGAAGGAPPPPPAAAGGSAAGAAAGAGAAAVDPKVDPKADPKAPVAEPTPAEKAAAEAKAAGELAAAVKALELKLPEGFKEDETTGKFKELAAKLGLKSEGAQGLLDFYAATQKEQAAAAQKEHTQSLEQLSVEYENTLKGDKLYGGQKYEESIQLARKALKAYAEPGDLAELKDFFSKTPLGNYPPLVKLLAKVGRASSEGKLEGTASEGGATPAASDDAFHRAIYSKTFAEHWDRKKAS